MKNGNKAKGRMSRREAQKEAVRRWGADAFARKSQTKGWVEVGSGLRDHRWGEALGSFENAFLTAEENAKPFASEETGGKPARDASFREINGSVAEPAPLYGAATDKCRFCGKAIRKDIDNPDTLGCWENAEGGSEEGTLSCEKNPDEALFEHEEEVAPHVPATATVPLHLWKGKAKRKEFEARLMARWPDLTRSNGGEGLSLYYTNADPSFAPYGAPLPRHAASWQGGIGWIFSRKAGK